MASRTKRIDELLTVLERTGGDPQRLEALRRTQAFKRSWMDLASTLVAVRTEGQFESWGFEDFYDYCAKELQLKRATVDKLTISFSTLQKHAPQVLKRDGLSKAIPSYQAIDYFQRAFEDSANGSAARNGKLAPPKPEVLRELKQAVFDEGQSVAELRKRFEPILHPTPKGAKQLDTLKQALSAARRLAELLPDIEGLSDRKTRALEQVLGELRNELEGLAEPLRAKYEPKRKPAAKAVEKQAEAKA